MKNLLIKLTGQWLNFLAVVSPDQAGRSGFNFFCRPFRQKLTRKHLSFLNDAATIPLDHKGVKVQTYQWGHGDKKVLFLHGWQSHTYRWRRFIESFDRNEYTIYALDAPGHGLSEGNFLSVPLYSDVIESLITREGRMDAVICHSVGCFAALYTFYRSPLITPKTFVAMASPGEASEFFDHYKNMLSLSPRSVRLILSRFQQTYDKSPEDFSAPKFAAALTIPGLLIHDDKDRDTDVDHARRIHKAWKNSTLVVTHGLGHNLRSEEITKRVFHFVEDVLCQTYS